MNARGKIDRELLKGAKEIPPAAARTIEGLRDTGYSLETAIADIVDNSIAANASRVDIYCAMEADGDIFVGIVDNGVGMDDATLEDAMRYGSRQRPHRQSLGKYGLGLKTASTAFCRQLSVVTRSAARSPVIKRQWDLDVVAAEDRWLLLSPSVDSYEEKLLEKTAGHGPGTAVIWRKVDRILDKDYKIERGAHAKKAFEKKIERLREHLEMTFQRFLDLNDDRAPNTEMYLNGDRLHPWDPFCSGLSEVVADQPIDVYSASGQLVAQPRFRAFVLPRKDEFPTEEAHKRARLSADMQGFYVYREQRLIHYGDWLGMHRIEPHFTLCRIEFSFDHRLDDALQLDIKKSRIQFREELASYLRDQVLSAPRRAAEDRYRRGLRKQALTDSEGLHAQSNRAISRREGEALRSETDIIDIAKGMVRVKNPKGVVVLKIPITSAARPGEVVIQPVESIDDGMLWQPAIIDKHHGVQINTGHPFYQRVYLPSRSESVVVQAVDFLLWALCEAELSMVLESTKTHMREVRYEVSRILRLFAEELPEYVPSEAAG